MASVVLPSLRTSASVMLMTRTRSGVLAGKKALIYILFGRDRAAYHP